ncbi:MAG TPA: aminotransferase class I/II-fold pyridoxal phosphate-dependent enzyme [Urbifossiella sp.]|nr:aminotransferase class I/II-fold pyridoxal phosphate-dependent enzyme [Urbifossiella sp.]
MSLPLDRLIASLTRTGMTRFFQKLFAEFPDLLMKDQTVEAVRPDRTFRMNGTWVTNFGSDSFLGFDQDLRVQEAIEKGVRDWGTHNGSSRAFSSVRPNVAAEEKIAAWMGTEAALIYPSVTLVNTGALPGLATRHDAIVGDQFAHNSIDEGMKIAKARCVRTAKFAHNDPIDLARVLDGLRPYRHAIIAVDGVYSMSGELPPLREFQKVAADRDAILYVDDAHGTGVLGERGRGTVLEAQGNYDNTLVVGSLSKAFSCLGGFVAGQTAACEVLKLRSNSLIFGGPVPPSYLEGIGAVIDILNSPEYDRLRANLDANVHRLTDGACSLGLNVLGGRVPIVSILVGAEEQTLQAGRFLFEHGYYVQSVIFPAVAHAAGVLRIQVNANHTAEQIDGLLEALAALKQAVTLPAAEAAVIRFPAVAAVPEPIPA